MDQNNTPNTDSYYEQVFKVSQIKSPAPKPERTPLFVRRGKDIIAASALILLSILFVSALFWDYLRAGYTITFAASMIIVSVFLCGKSSHITPFSVLCGILSLMCSLSFAVTSNYSVRIISFFVLAFSSTVWFSYLAGRKYKASDFGILKYAVSSMIRGNGDMPKALVCLFSKGGTKSKTASRILIGVGCAIPLLLVIVPLLMKSDDAFYYLINNINTDFTSEIRKIFLGLLVCPLIIGFVFSLKYNKKQKESAENNRGINGVTVSTFLCVTSVVYLVYLFSQTAYFTSAFLNILPKGYKFTYAEYARRGFFELCVIAAINLLIILLSIAFTKKKDGKLPVSVKIPATFIALFTLVIIATSISKMVMYINEYGMTVLRICTSAFMVWMATVFIAAIVRIYVKKFDVLATGLIFALLILSVLGIFNVNSYIAKYNYNAYVNGDAKIDVDYMSELGDEGVKYLYELTKADDEKIASKAGEELNRKIELYYYEPEPVTQEEKEAEDYKPVRRHRGIGTFYFAREEAYETIEQYAKETGAFKNITYYR